MAENIGKGRAKCNIKYQHTSGHVYQTTTYIKYFIRNQIWSWIDTCNSSSYIETRERLHSRSDNYKYLQRTWSRILLLTEGGTPFVAMQRRAPFMSRVTDVIFNQAPLHLLAVKWLAYKVLRATERTTIDILALWQRQDMKFCFVLLVLRSVLWVWTFSYLFRARSKKFQRGPVPNRTPLLATQSLWHSHEP